MSDETKAIDDKATTPEPAAAPELTDKDLGQVSGGVMAQDVAVKHKSEAKVAETIDAILRR